VHIQVLLEVEVGQLVTLLQAKKLQQLGIGVDVMLVLQVVLLHVVRDELGDIGAALLAARRAAQEGAELRADVGGDLEDAHTNRLALLALNRGLATATLVSHLLGLGRNLLQTLGLRDQLRESLAKSQKTGRNCTGTGLETNLLNRGSLLRGGRCRDRDNSRGHNRGGGTRARCLRCRSRSSSSCRGSGGGLGRSLGGGGRGGGGGGGSNGCRNFISLLGHTLDRLRRGCNGRAHYITGGG